MSDMRGAGSISPGSGTPFTVSGRSIGYRPPPWRMRGRCLAIWYLLADPAEAHRHVPRGVSMDPDPVVRARFWDLVHDGSGPAADADRVDTWTPIREAVVAFPVSYGPLSGDLPVYMYADDFAYTAFGRELMGWPVRDAVMELDPEPAEGPAAGVTVTARMLRGGLEVMRAELTLTGGMASERLPTPPRWLAEKVIGRVDRPGAEIAQLVATGPERIDRRDLWDATGSLAFTEAPGDELHLLAPRQVVRAQYWCSLELQVGWGKVLAELGDAVYDRG